MATATFNPAIIGFLNQSDLNPASWTGDSIRLAKLEILNREYRGFLSYDLTDPATGTAPPANAIFTGAEIAFTGGTGSTDGGLTTWRVDIYSGFALDISEEATMWSAGDAVGSAEEDPDDGEPPATFTFDCASSYLTDLRVDDEMAFRLVWDCEPAPPDLYGQAQYTGAVLTLTWVLPITTGLEYDSRVCKAVDARSGLCRSHGMDSALKRSLSASSGLGRALSFDSCLRRSISVDSGF